ncbi:hypothetical protein BX600DRAFT_253226 [Xylariales sp. PMI_506]|nr:hypothetical protein BX600DRAFT_253226 [Xylariales sp. PMI_506]
MRDKLCLNYLTSNKCSCGQLSNSEPKHCAERIRLDHERRNGHCPGYDLRYGNKAACGSYSPEILAIWSSSRSLIGRRRAGSGSRYADGEQGNLRRRRCGDYILSFTSNWKLLPWYQPTYSCAGGLKKEAWVSLPGKAAFLLAGCLTRVAMMVEWVVPAQLPTFSTKLVRFSGEYTALPPESGSRAVSWRRHSSQVFEHHIQILRHSWSVDK